MTMGWMFMFHADDAMTRDASVRANLTFWFDKRD
jgi:hypothetical protein